MKKSNKQMNFMKGALVLTGMMLLSPILRNCQDKVKPNLEIISENYTRNLPRNKYGSVVNYGGYDVTKGIDENGSKYLELRDGFCTRLERPTTLIWRNDSIQFSPGKDMGRGIHLEDSTHYFKSLNTDSLERIFKESK